MALAGWRTNADANGGECPSVAAKRGSESRSRILDLSVGVVEDLRRSSASDDRSPEAFCADFQICLPYRGLFVWHVGKDDVVGDPNQIVFVRGGEGFRVSSPCRRGYAELIVTPDIGIVSEIAHVNGRSLFEHPLFRRRAVRVAPHLQAARARVVHWAMDGSPPESLEAEETVIALLRSALQHDLPAVTASGGAATARLIRRAKEVVNERLAERLRLTDIARAAGASPAYLTDLFRRAEGISLHQYLTQLRLSRALLELPHVDDLTVLALELGFSSHSHFTYAFRRMFGCTPSNYRKGGRRS